MWTDISREELALLEYLHEHAGVRGGRIGLDPKVIKRELRISAARLDVDSASLAAQGLAGVRHTRTGSDERPSSTCSAIWVTIKGEDYLTRSRRRPGAVK